MVKKRIINLTASLLMSSIFIMSNLPLFSAATLKTAEAAVSSWQKGVSMVPGWPGDFDTDSFRQALKNAHDAGADTAVLIIPMYQADIHSSDIYAGWNTPTDEALTSATKYAKSLGMKVVYKLHVDPSNGDWRANINASDRDSWYRNYGNSLNHLGDIAKQNGVSGMVIGTELISMAAFTVNQDNTARWNTMISNLRKHFSGFLTYSANWGGSDYAEETPHIAFWGSLDYIGISAYYPLAENNSNPSKDALTGSWSYWDNAKIKTISDQYGKPVLFTEIGYRSVDNAHNLPWYAGPSGGYNANEQVIDFDALFSYWNNQSHMAGIYIWDWDTDPNYGGQGNTDFTPQHKPAQSTIASWFGNSTTPPDNNPNPPPSNGGPSSVSGNWNFNAQIPSLSSGQSSNLSLNIGISDKASNVIVDVEIYNSSGSQVLQKVFNGQNINSQASNYQIPWTPSSNGSYTLKVGIFNSDWSHLYIWNDSVTVMNVGQSGGNDGNNGGTPSGPLSIDIWWPTDGSWVSGVQPFKAMVPQRSVNEYTMYWQVDNGNLVEMGNSDVDYPHKEAWVDLGPWNWTNNNQYNLNFVAKDSSGKVVAEKKSTINVAH